MGLFSEIRNIFGMRKDRLEAEKVKLELKKLKEEPIIQKPNFKEIERFDLKLKELNEKIIKGDGERIRRKYEGKGVGMNIGICLEILFFLLPFLLFIIALLLVLL